MSNNSPVKESTLKRKDQNPVDSEKEDIINSEEERESKKSKICEVNPSDPSSSDPSSSDPSSSDPSSSYEGENRCDSCSCKFSPDTPPVRCSGIPTIHCWPCNVVYCTPCNEKMHGLDKTKKCRFCKEFFCSDCYENEHPRPKPENGPCDVREFECRVCQLIKGIEDIIICGGTCGEGICCKDCVSKIEEKPVKCTLCNEIICNYCSKEHVHYLTKSKTCDGKVFMSL